MWLPSLSDGLPTERHATSRDKLIAATRSSCRLGVKFDSVNNANKKGDNPHQHVDCLEVVGLAAHSIA